MRVVALIFMILSFLVGGLCAGILFVNINARMEGVDYKQVETVQKEVDALKKSGVDVTKIEDEAVQESLEWLEKIPAKWKVDTAGPLGVLVAVLALVMVVIAFMKKPAVTKISLAVAVLALLLWIIAPDIKPGLFSGANPKTIALIAFIGLTVSSLCAFMSYKLHAKKVAA